MDSRQLKSLFSEIIIGYSYFNNKDFGPIFIKHFTPLDSADVDYIYNESYNKAINEGLLCQKDKEAELIKQDLWTSKQEDKAKELKQFINNLNNTISKEYLKSRRDQYKKSIIETEKDIKKLESEKQNLIGNTAEYFAIKKSNEFYIELSFFKDKECKQPLFNHEEFEDLEQDKLENLIKIFNKYNENLSHDNIRQIALSPIFLNMFYMSSENPYYFYGKPIIYLTFHQTDLYSFGKYYKNVMSEYGSKIPQNILNDGDKLNEWLEINKNAERVVGDSGDKDGAISYVGATKSDLEILGVNTSNVVNFNEIAKKKGKKSLSMADMLEMDK